MRIPIVIHLHRNHPGHYSRDYEMSDKVLFDIHLKGRGVEALTIILEPVKVFMVLESLEELLFFLQRSQVPLNLLGGRIRVMFLGQEFPVVEIDRKPALVVCEVSVVQCTVFSLPATIFGMRGIGRGTEFLLFITFVDRLSRLL